MIIKEINNSQNLSKTFLFAYKYFQFYLLSFNRHLSHISEHIKKSFLRGMSA